MNDFPGTGIASRRIAGATLLAVAWGIAPPVAAAPYRIASEPVLRVETRAFFMAGGTNRTLGSADLELGVGERAPWTVRLPPDRPTAAPDHVLIHAAGQPAPAGGNHRVDLAAGFVREDGVQVKIERRLDLREGTTGFFEAGHGPGWRLTLAVTPFRGERPVVRVPASPGAPVLFRVEVGRVLQGKYVALETNELNTFVLQPVAYSFRLGQGDSLEELRLELTPRRIEDDLVEVGVVLTGALHAGRDAPLLLSRDDLWFTGRGTTSTVEATAGEPPDGFRFRVTPLW
jgi:hypothetical protein